MAKAGLESAFWDLSARALGQSLAQMIGGVRERVDVGVSVSVLLADMVAEGVGGCELR